MSKGKLHGRKNAYKLGEKNLYIGRKNAYKSQLGVLTIQGPVSEHSYFLKYRPF